MERIRLTERIRICRANRSVGSAMSSHWNPYGRRRKETLKNDIQYCIIRFKKKYIYLLASQKYDDFLLNTCFLYSKYF